MDNGATTIKCRSRSASHCQHGEDAASVYPEGVTMEQDGTWDGHTVICDACYIHIGVPMIGTDAFNSGQADRELNNSERFALALGHIAQSSAKANDAFTEQYGDAALEALRDASLAALEVCAHGVPPMTVLLALEGTLKIEGMIQGAEDVIGAAPADVREHALGAVLGHRSAPTTRRAAEGGHRG